MFLHGGPEPAGGAIIDVLDRSLMTQPGITQPRPQSPLVTIGGFSVEQEGEPFGMREIGSNKGGSALWMADMTRSLGIGCQIHSVDIEPVTGITAESVTFHRGDARNLGAAFGPDFINALPRPLLVIEDSSHDADTTYAAVTCFDAWLRPGEYIVIEDWILTDMGYAAAYGGAPLAAIERFLRSHGEKHEIDRWSNWT
jgi:cephalosporin hydroxylase